MSQYVCEYCKKVLSTPKGHHCLKNLQGLGTRKEFSRFRGSSIGRQIDGNIELAYYRGYHAGQNDARRGIWKYEKEKP